MFLSFSFFLPYTVMQKIMLSYRSKLSCEKLKIPHDSVDCRFTFSRNEWK